MTQQAEEGLDLDTSAQLPDDDLHTDTDAPDAEIDPADDEDVEVTFGEKSDDDAQDEDGDETPVIRAMRKREREKDKELRKAKRELELLRQQQQPANAVPELPPKPTLESCDWDTDKHERELLAWHEQSRKVESAKAEQQNAVQARLKSYQDQAKTLKAKDFKEAEDEVATVFDPTRQSILLEAADNPALLVYALGKNPDQLERLSKITSLAKFAAELGKLEKEMKVSRTSTKPAPTDTNLRGSAPVSSAGKPIERLRAQAQKTGDYTAYHAALRKKGA